MSYEGSITAMTHLVEALTAPERDTLKPVINQRISLLVSKPFPGSKSAQMRLFTSFKMLWDTLHTYHWESKDLSQRIEDLGNQLVEHIIGKDSSENTLQDYHVDLDLLRFSDNIGAHCALEADKYLGLELRKHEIVESIIQRAEQALNTATKWKNQAEQSIGHLSILAQLREFLIEPGDEKDRIEIDGMIERLMNNVAIECDTGRNLEHKEDIDTHQSMIPGQPDTTSSSAESSSIKGERLACTALDDTAQHESPVPLPLQSFFAERAARHEARQREQKLLDRQERKAQAQAQKEAVANDPTKAEQLKYAKEVGEQLKKDKAEKMKILARIEDDKVVRKEKAEQTRLKKKWVEEAKMKKEDVKDEEGQEDIS